MDRLSNRVDYTRDPLSPFQPSPPDIGTLSTRHEASYPQSDLNFSQQDITTPSWNSKVITTPSGSAPWINGNNATPSDVMTTKKASPQPKRHHRLKEEISLFCNETSFTALVLIYTANSCIRRFVWTLVFLAMMIGLILQSYWLFDKYFSYPMEVKIDIITAKEIEFPSVTVCNLNPIKAKVLDRSPSFAELKHFSKQLGDDVLYNYILDNYNSMYPGQLPDQGQPNSYSATPGSTHPDTRSPSSQTRTTAHTPTRSAPSEGPASVSAQTPSAAPPSRRKRSAGENVELSSPTKTSTTFDPYQQRHDPGSRSTDSQAYLTSDLHEGEKHRGLGEGEAAKRVRRGTEYGQEELPGHRKEVLKNNSYNKWDALQYEGVGSSYYETRSAEFTTTMSYATLSAQLADDEVEKCGHTLQDLLISCLFNGWQCSPSNFTHFHNHKYGNCYTFNSYNSSRQLNTTFSGAEYGLTLEMYIQQDEYVPALAPEAGVRVLIHPKGTYPFPEDDGFSIQPSRSTSVSIRKIEFSRLEPPHGTCHHEVSPLDAYVKNFNSSYSKLSCLKSCYQNIVNRHCNCSAPMYYISDKNDVCNMTDDAVAECVANLSDCAANELNECDNLCHQPCYQVDYDMVISSAAWPSKVYTGYLQSKVEQCNYLLMDGNISEDAEDFVKLSVYFKDLLVQRVVQQEGYESTALISDIGGQLGLWLGLSVVTLGELCGLIFSLFQSLSSVAPDNGK